MGCEQCGDEFKTIYAAVWVDLAKGGNTFCSRACLRAWLAATEPLTDPKPQPETGRLSPQHVVVPWTIFMPQLGESAEDWCKRLQAWRVNDPLGLR